MLACKLAGALILIAAAPALRGQAAGPAVEQLDHMVWTIRDGAPSGVSSLAQSPDGVLWIGTNTGLYRFDGVHFERVDLPSLAINTLLALPDGTLWIGYLLDGASELSGGRVVSYNPSDGVPIGTVNTFARDSAGDVWVGTTTGLARLHAGHWQQIGPEHGYPGGMTPSLFVDRRGTLWAHNKSGIYTLPRGGTQFVRQGPPLDRQNMGMGEIRQAADGSIWASSMTIGLTQLADTAGRATPQRAAAPHLHDAALLTIDRHANAWVGGATGLVRVPLAPQAFPVERVPLSNVPYPNAVLEDREGNVWVATERGLERFRETKLTPVRFAAPVAGPSLAPALDGSVWIASFFRPPIMLGDRDVVRAGPSDMTCAYRDLEGGVWFGGPSGIWHAVQGAHWKREPLPDLSGAGDVQAIARTPSGDLWVSVRGQRTRGVFRRRGRAWSRAPLPVGVPNQMALAVVADSANRVWLGYPGNRLMRVDHDSLRMYSDPDGLRVGSVTALLVRGPRLWIGGESGLMMLDDGRFLPLDATEPLLGITGIVETSFGDLWLNGAGGVTHIEAAEVRRALSNPGYHARAERFDYHDGLPGQALQLRPVPSAIEGTDGRLWFTTETGVAWIDPRNIKRNSLPPPVEVRAVSAGGKRYDAGPRVVLPARTTQLEIQYMALSFAMPDRVQFRYRLAGVDTAWVDAGTRREAFYTNLKPGPYRFQVIAANEDGVWNDAGATVNLDIPPTFTQTKAFLVLIVTAAVCAAWLFVLWRQREMERTIRAQFEARLAERTRVARELHDTLLGDLTGVAMQLSAAAHRAASADAPPGAIADLLTRLSTQVQRSLVEARRSVTDMRASSTDAVPLLHAQLTDAAHQTFAGSGITAHVEHVGSPHPYPPAVGAEILGIASEAMANARQHADCRTVTITCNYAPDELHLRVHDDGQGFDPTHATPMGHWGLVGMRERAATIGAHLSVESARGAGTEVRLVVKSRDLPK